MAQTVAVTIKGHEVHAGGGERACRRHRRVDQQDFVAHTTTARSGDWDIKIAPGKTGSVVIKKAGNFAYYCRFHPNMTGTVTAD